MLFFVTWNDRASVLLDVENEAAARVAALEIAAEPPRKCKPVPLGVAAFEVFLDDDEDGAELLVVEPLDHAASALLALEEEDEDEEASPVPRIGAPRCDFELEDDDQSILRCERPAHPNDARHEARDAKGAMVEWEDAG